MLQGITLCWARYGQDQLTDLFYVYFLLFLTVGKKTLLEKSLNLPLHPAFSFFKENRHSGIAGSALFVSAAMSLPPVLLCSPLHPHSYWQALERISWGGKKGGKKRSESLLFLIFPDPFIIFIHSEQHLTLPSHPPLLGISRGLCSFSPASRCALQFCSYPEHDSIKRGKESG